MPNKPLKNDGPKAARVLAAALGTMKLGAFRAVGVTVVALIAGCESRDMKPIASVEEGVRLVESFKGSPQDFQLAVPDTMLDPVGVNMAIITDHVLKRGWEPDGFSQASGYRVYRYKALK